MITLTKRFEFEASHWLTGMQEGHVCAAEHQHAYAVEFSLTADDLMNGLIIDAGKLKIDIAPIIKRLRGQCLNDLTDPAPWSKRLAEQPSVEHLAMYFWDACQFLSKGGRFRLRRIRVYESPMIWAEVSE